MKEIFYALAIAALIGIVSACNGQDVPHGYPTGQIVTPGPAIDCRRLTSHVVPDSVETTHPTAPSKTMTAATTVTATPLIIFREITDLHPN